MFSHGLLGVWLSHHTNPLANNHPSTQWLGENSHPVISSATHLISQFCKLQPLLVAHSFPSYWLKHRFFSSHVTTMQKVMVAWGTPKKSRESGNHPSNTATLHRGSPFHTPTSHPQNQGRPLALRPAGNSLPRKRTKRPRVTCALPAPKLVDWIMRAGRVTSLGTVIYIPSPGKKHQKWRKKCSTLPSTFLSVYLLDHFPHLPWEVPKYLNLVFVASHLTYAKLELTKFGNWKHTMGEIRYFIQ